MAGRRAALRAGAALAMGALAVGACPAAHSTPPDSAAQALYLDAFVNGVEKGLIIRVDQRAGRLYTSADELSEIGIRTQSLPLDADRQIALDAIPGLTHAYDERLQRIDFVLPLSALVSQPIGYVPEPVPMAQSATGIVLNYAARVHLNRIDLDAPAPRRMLPAHAAGFGSLPVISRQAHAQSNERRNRTFSFGLDSRVFSPRGVLVGTGYATHGGGASDFVRQDTFWAASSPDRIRSYRVGDFISASLPWTRSIRMGGVRVSRNFALRPDLVTFPVPELGGNAVVPTTVDLYVNNLHQFSGQATGGPFVIATPPALSGAGTAVVRYRDALGREVVDTRRLYVDTRLMGKGLADYSFELGYPRRSYGARSFSYADSAATSASLRYGASDLLTLEGHFEAGRNLRNLGAGMLWQLGRFGVANLAVAGSDGVGQGALTSAGYQYIAPRWSVDLRDIRTHSDYRDLGSAEDVPVPLHLTRASVGLSIGAKHHLMLDYTRQDRGFDFGGSRIVMLGYSGTFGTRVNVFASVFADLVGDQPAGAYVGISMMFDRRISASAGASRFGDERTASVNVGRPVDHDLGGFGWTVAAEGGNEGYRDGGASVRYQGRYADITAEANAGRIKGVGYRNASVYGEGAIVYMDRAWMASRPIYDAFAMVDVQERGIAVLRENRRVGVSGRGGRLLIPDLLPYQSNHLAIDPLGLPLNATVENERMVVAPREWSGVVVRFPVRRFTGATVVLVDEQGRFVPEGASAVLADTGETALVGYDGQVFFESLRPRNTVSVSVDGRVCKATFDFSETDTMSVMGPFVCTGLQGVAP